jgi:hypothetical protein
VLLIASSGGNPTASRHRTIKLKSDAPMRANRRLPEITRIDRFREDEGFIKFRALREDAARVPRALRAAGTENLNDVRTILPLGGRDGTNRDLPLSRRKTQAAR